MFWILKHVCLIYIFFNPCFITCRFEGFMRLQRKPFVYTPNVDLFFFLSGGAAVSGGASACATADCV